MANRNLKNLRILEKYYHSILRDSKSTPKRKDQAANKLLKLVGTRAKLRSDKERILQRKGSMGGKEVNTVRDVEALTKTDRRKLGKKRIRDVQSDEIASTDDEWSDLIPKAQVVDLGQARTKRQAK